MRAGAPESVTFSLRHPRMTWLSVLDLLADDANVRLDGMAAVLLAKSTMRGPTGKLEERDFACTDMRANDCIMLRRLDMLLDVPKISASRIGVELRPD